MIYNCWNCGWRINQRGRVKDEDIGKYVLFQHMCFCSSYCVNDFIQRRGKKIKSSISDWDENGYNREWKKNRKVLRERPKNRHGNKINI